MMTVYETYWRKRIDLSALGLHKGEKKSSYFCTPRGAKIIGWAGVDGIHYCFLKAFGEMVFAVNPMGEQNDYVHPIAKSFEDLLRLLLACGSLDALEQAHSWDQDAFDAYVNDIPHTSEYTAALNILQNTLQLTPMPEPFAYVKALQAEFDYAAIPYQKDYYEWVPTPPAKPEKPAWRVVYGHGFFPRKGRERSGVEIRMEKTFFWDSTSWYIPAVYACTAGLVIDFCISAEAEAFKAFWDKWTDESGQECDYTEEEQLQIALENPLRPQFDASVLVNGKRLLEKCSYGQSWLPPSCRPEDFSEEQKGRWIVEHYGLDEEKCWMFRRVSFPWVTKRKPIIRSMELTLKQNPLTFPGPCFSVSGIGDSFSFTHPISGAEHKLTVVEYEQQEMDTSRLGNSEMDYPSHYTAMTYALEPDLPKHAVSVQDCQRGDRPRPKKVDPMSPKATNDIILAVIGSADGPTAVFFTRSGSQPHAACSALHFERQTNVDWRMTFHEKTIEDLTLPLL